MRLIREENCKVKVVSVHVTKVHGGIEVQPPHFLPRHWMEVIGQYHAPAVLLSARHLGTH
jgi:hypothetical protein